MLVFKKKNSKSVDVKVILINSFIFFLIAYFSYHSLSGARGLIAFYKLKKEVAVQSRVLLNLKSESEALEQKVKMLHPEKVDVDFIDELARRELGMLSKDELLVNLKD